MDIHDDDELLYWSPQTTGPRLYPPPEPVPKVTRPLTRLDIVAARMLMDRNDLPPWHCAEHPTATGLDTPVTPTGHYEKLARRNASRSPSLPPDLCLKIQRWTGDIGKLLRGIETLCVDDRGRIAREMAASVIQHRIDDLLAGGAGVDHRDAIDIDLEELFLRCR